MGRTLAIGDIHGCYTALITLEQQMPIAADDTVIALGDYVDRGPDSRRVLEWMIARLATGKLVPLRGNHEVMMSWSLGDPVSQKSWMNDYVGGRQTLESYGEPNAPGKMRDVPDSHWHFMMQQTLRWHETEKFIFAHANVAPGVLMDAQTDDVLMWSGFGPQGIHISGKRLICGHTQQNDGLPLVMDHGACIDTHAFGRNGWLTCLDVETGHYAQANQKGEFRTGMLEEWV